MDKRAAAHPDLQLLWNGKAILGEGPVWDYRSKQLIWVDIMGMAIHWFDPATEVERTFQLDRKIGAAVPCVHGSLMLALDNGFHELDVASGRLTKVNDPEGDKPGNRFNDGKCDAAGRFWAGTMDMNEERPWGALYCLDTDGTVRKVLEGVTVSNGLCWSGDNRTMYYIDSPTRKVMAYDYELRTGELSNPRVAVRIPEGEGFPDGMDIDTEGNLWIAQWDGWQVGRYDPRTGRKLGSIPVPAARTSSCAFGGDGFDTLYITTARVGISEDQLADQPTAGGVFCIKPGYRGLPSYAYGVGAGTGTGQ